MPQQLPTVILKELSLQYLRSSVFELFRNGGCSEKGKYDTRPNSNYYSDVFTCSSEIVATSASAGDVRVGVRFRVVALAAVAGIAASASSFAVTVLAFAEAGGHLPRTMTIRTGTRLDDVVSSSTAGEYFPLEKNGNLEQKLAVLVGALILMEPPPLLLHPPLLEPPLLRDERVGGRRFAVVTVALVEPFPFADELRGHVAFVVRGDARPAAAHAVALLVLLGGADAEDAPVACPAQLCHQVAPSKDELVAGRQGVRHHLLVRVECEEEVFLVAPRGGVGAGAIRWPPDPAGANAGVEDACRVVLD